MILLDMSLISAISFYQCDLFCFDIIDGFVWIRGCGCDELFIINLYFYLNSREGYHWQLNIVYQHAEGWSKDSQFCFGVAKKKRKVFLSNLKKNFAMNKSRRRSVIRILAGTRIQIKMALWSPQDVELRTEKFNYNYYIPNFESKVLWSKNDANNLVNTEEENKQKRSRCWFGAERNKKKEVIFLGDYTITWT